MIDISCKLETKNKSEFLVYLNFRFGNLFCQV